MASIYNVEKCVEKTLKSGRRVTGINRDYRKTAMKIAQHVASNIPNCSGVITTGWGSDMGTIRVCL